MPGSKSRRRLFVGLIVLFNLALIGGVAAVFFYLTERYIERQRPATLVYRPHPFRRHVLVPGQSYRRSSVSFEIGAHGFRGPVPEEKRDGVLRVVAVGGSSVFDHLVTGGQSWSERLGPLLETRGVGDVEAFNFGVPGYSSRETLAVAQDVLPLHAPDVVLFYLGWNDVKYMKAFRKVANPDLYYSYRGAFETQYRFLQAPRPWRNFHAFQKMLTARGVLAENVARAPAPAKAEAPLVDTSSVAWAETGGLAYWRRNIEAFVRTVRAQGARPVLVAQNTLVVADLASELRERVVYRYVQVEHDELVALNEAMVGVLRDVAQHQEVLFVDVREAINGRPAYFSDHVHMKAEGSAAFAEALAEALAPVLAGSTSW